MIQGQLRPQGSMTITRTVSRLQSGLTQPNIGRSCSMTSQVAQATKNNQKKYFTLFLICVTLSTAVSGYYYFLSEHLGGLRAQAVIQYEVPNPESQQGDDLGKQLRNIEQLKSKNVKDKLVQGVARIFETPVPHQIQNIDQQVMAETQEKNREKPSLLDFPQDLNFEIQQQNINEQQIPPPIRQSGQPTGKSKKMKNKSASDVDYLNQICCQMDSQFFPLNQSTLKPPELIGIGAHKAGTTFLNSILRSSKHLAEPKSEIKELLTWAQWPLTPDHFASYLEEWDEKVKGKDKNHIKYEFSATYLHYPSVACRIKKLLPNVKFVVTLREPVQRCLSHFNFYYHYWAMGKRAWQFGGIQPDFRVAVKQEIDAMQSAGCATEPNDTSKLSYEECFKCQYIKRDNQAFAHACEVLGHRREGYKLSGQTPCEVRFRTQHYLQYGLYAQQIQMWLKLFPKENFMFIKDKDMFADPVGTGNKVLKFLGKPQDITFESFEEAIVTNDQEYKFGRKSEQFLAVKDLLKNFYAPHIEALYDLFKQYDIEFEPFVEWPVNKRGKLKYYDATAPNRKRMADKNVTSDTES